MYVFYAKFAVALITSVEMEHELASILQVCYVQGIRSFPVSLCVIALREEINFFCAPAQNILVGLPVYKVSKFAQNFEMIREI
jgi:uridine phosphorylase